jgi:hypothetical protein
MNHDNLLKKEKEMSKYIGITRSSYGSDLECLCVISEVGNNSDIL